MGALTIIVVMRKGFFFFCACWLAFFLILGYQDTLFMYNISGTVSNTRLGTFPTVLSIILFLSFCIIRFVKFKNKKLKVLLMSGIFLLWLLAGRVVGYNVWNNSIVGGWQNLIKTREICIGRTDQTLEMQYEIEATQITKLPFWFLKIENTKINTILYVGPFIWQGALEIFEKEGFKIRECTVQISP